MNLFLVSLKAYYIWIQPHACGEIHALFRNGMHMVDGPWKK